MPIKQQFFFAVNKLLIPEKGWRKTYRVAEKIPNHYTQGLNFNFL